MKPQWIVLICIGSVIWLCIGARVWYKARHQGKVDDGFTDPGQGLLLFLGSAGYLGMHLMMYLDARKKSQANLAKSPISLKKEIN